MKRMRLITLGVATCLLLVCLMPTIAAANRDIVEYSYNLRQTSASSSLTVTEEAERWSNAGSIVPAVNRLTETNASHNIYFKLVDSGTSTARTNVYWHKTGRYQYEWLDTEVPPGSWYQLAMRRNTSDTNSTVTATGSWSPDLYDVIIN